MQQRYYDPQIGRFLSVDPVTAYSNPVGAFNRYWYANNNPYKFTDPDGRAPATRDKVDWRSIAARSPGSAPAMRLASVNNQSAKNTIAPSGAKTYGPLKGGYVYGSVGSQAPSPRSSVQSGSGTVQLGVVLSGTLGLAHISVEGGVAGDNRGNIALYTETSVVGGGPKADAHAAVSLKLTNANTVNDLAGTSHNVDVGGGLGPYGSLGGMTAETPSGDRILGAGGTFGPGAGAGGSVSQSETVIYPIAN
jgi:uncharacterized protein RhaS with RHS repeats